VVQGYCTVDRAATAYGVQRIVYRSLRAGVLGDYGQILVNIWPRHGRSYGLSPLVAITKWAHSFFNATNVIRFTLEF
jgi:hypothetical protein